MTEETQSGTQHAPHTEPDLSKAETKTVMAILAYIGPLILVPFLLAKDEPFVKFHIKQGLLLVIGEVATWLLVMLFWPIFPIVKIVNIFLLVLAIVGIIRAAKGEQKELPLVGHWARKVEF